MLLFSRLYYDDVCTYTNVEGEDEYDARRRAYRFFEPKRKKNELHAMTLLTGEKRRMRPANWTRVKRKIRDDSTTASRLSRE